MEENLVSRHVLDASHYEGKGKWEGVIQGWIVFLVIFIATLIPAVRQALLGFADSVKSVEWVVTSVHFLLNGLLDYSCFYGNWHTHEMERKTGIRRDLHL